MYTHRWISSLCAKHTVFYVLPTHIHIWWTDFAFVCLVSSLLFIETTPFPLWNHIALLLGGSGSRFELVTRVCQSLGWA